MRTTVSALSLMACCGMAAAQFTGPSSSQSPYVVPTMPGVSTTSIFTVGDTVGGYQMVGIPDGLGAFSNNDGTFTLMMNHELGATVGAVRAHGSTGGFVSRWTIGNDLTVQAGRDHNTSAADVNTWNGAAYTQGTTQYNRLCSADLAAPSAFRFGTLGTDARIFMNGEESGAEGRAFAHIATGPAMNSSYQLPRLGRFSWENSVASPFAQQKTVVLGTDDSTPGQVYMYVGSKTAAGNDIERAGLTNGGLYGLRVAGSPSESRATGFTNARFEMASLGNVENLTGAQVQSSSTSVGITEFLRPEDGAWDTRPGFENDFYFVTTDRFDSQSQLGRSRLYRMRFDDITQPEMGGALTQLLSSDAGVQMMDNICIDSHGRILIQEDIGNNAALGKIWLFDTNSGNRAVIAQHDPFRFASPVPPFSLDEESSGIIDARDILGDGWFLLDSQAHYANGSQLVEGGQLLAMYVDPSIAPAPGAIALLGLGGLVVTRRRRS